MPKTDLVFQNPLMNAAGTLGFSPNFKGPVNLDHFGAFITNPISQIARTPTRGERYLPYPGGFLLHCGYPNPGLQTILQHHAPRWARSALPIIVHLLAQDPVSTGQMIQKLERVEGLLGVEIGLPPNIDPDMAYQITMAAVGELALIVRVPFEQVNGTHPDRSLFDALSQAGANALSLAPARGTLLDTSGSPVSGRLYGPALFPQALSAVTWLVKTGLPVIAAGGIYNKHDIQAMLAAGATAIQLDAVLWRGAANDFSL